MRFHLGNLFEAYRSLENLDSGYLPYRSETSTDKKFISNTYRLINKKQYENFITMVCMTLPPQIGNYSNNGELNKLFSFIPKDKNDCKKQISTYWKSKTKKP